MGGYFWSINNNQSDCIDLGMGGGGSEGGGGGQTVYQGADPGFEVWCSDPERREFTPELCDGDPQTM